MPWLLLLIPAALVAGYVVVKAATPSAGTAGATNTPPAPGGGSGKVYGINVGQASPAPLQMHVGDTVVFSTQIDPSADEDNQQGCGLVSSWYQGGTEVFPGNGVAGNIFTPNNSPTLNAMGSQPDANGYVTATYAYLAVLPGTATLQFHYEDFTGNAYYGDADSCPYPASTLMTFVVS